MLQDQKLGLLPWSPLAGGFLTGKFVKTGSTDGDARRNKFNFPPLNTDKGFSIVEVLKTIATRKKASVPQVALAWLLHQPFVTSIIIGAKKAAQLKDNLGSIDVTLDAEQLKQLDEVSRLAPEYPGWMQNMPSTRRPGEKRDWAQVAKTT